MYNINIEIKKILNFLIIAFLVITFIGCGNSTSTAPESTQKQSATNTITPDTVDAKVEDKFNIDNTTQLSPMSNNQRAFIGNWYGKENYLQVRLQLRSDGSYK
ncbi:hypothetical protein MNB_SM-6-797 [hydrothermal vent metagenome]|uniref:Uncharacterized protein n=1 Tax=hydrothermal vent metagenome TaxID=652676 RepID=A0A1W1CWZ2_9ZZZZ